MEAIEVWKDIKGYEGHYQVSDLGRVKSLARVVEMRKSILGNKKEIFLKPTKNRKGYLNLKLCKKTDGIYADKSVIVHRLVASEFLENPLNHKIDGTIWKNGQFGSRWADTMINGIYVRLAFYTRKSDIKALRMFQINIII